ncbi:MAG: hypothetical protein HY517_04055 [Candidatus Aenigmarchaeota archaeon]|nr:hypothetical protein [Candidatus Aenigmarchaeota archaeon]
MRSEAGMFKGSNEFSAVYGNCMDATAEFLSGISKYRALPWGHSLLSERCIMSAAYYRCRALVIMDGNLGGLSHIYPKEESKEHVDYFIRELKKRRKRAKAFTVSPGNSEDIRKLCRHCKEIELIDVGTDNFPDYDHSRRDVILMVPEREVIIFTDEGEGRRIKIPE